MSILERYGRTLLYYVHLTQKTAARRGTRSRYPWNERCGWLHEGERKVGWDVADAL